MVASTAYSNEFFLVQYSAPRQPAFHICRFPVSQPSGRFRKVVVPFPRREASARGAHAIESLLLPEGFAGQSHHLVASQLSPGLSSLWADDPESPLILPLHVLDHRRFERDWGTLSMATPGSVGVAVERAELADVAWAVLTRASAEQLTIWLSQISRFVERFPGEPGVHESLVEAMRVPAAIRGPLRAAARAGHPVFHPRGILWILREVLAADEEEKQRYQRWTPGEADGRSWLAHAWFRCLRANRPPGLDEVLLAAWMLHEEFRGADIAVNDADDVLAMTTALGFGFGTGGRWLPILERCREIWMVSDDHPAVVGSPLKPSVLRSRFGRELGVPVEQWIAGVWALCLRWWFSTSRGPSVSGDPAELFRLPFEGESIEFNDGFINAFRQFCVGSLDDLAHEARREAGDDYAGLGSLPQSDSLACRNHPVVEVSNGWLVPLSIGLVAERVRALPRLLLGARGESAVVFGKLFEVYVWDILQKLAGRHHLVSEHDITAAVGETRRCDALVGYGQHYLAIEVAVQTLSRGVADGRVDAILNMAERYQDEADQAIATIEKMRTITDHLQLPSMEAAAHLVVTESPVPHSPVFLDKLHVLRPDRTPKFVCSAADLELLVELDRVGWEVPAAVMAWQGHRDRAPLQSHLSEMARDLPPTHDAEADESIERWLACLPRRAADAA